ncbi:MAG TPA: S-layer homology domain-containing protein [Tepidanaerobacteraceae bacterium]|nr:S-layer homology domain-containing protein [Tepidanaerobacteraceae bacterium]
MRKKLVSIVALILILSMLLPLCAMAADDPVRLEEISERKPGQNVKIEGSTDLAEVTVKVIRPSGSVMYINVLKVTEGKFSDGFTLPGDAETGEYTVVVGQGDIVGKVNFKVKDSGEEPGGPGGGGGSSKPKEEPEEPTPVKKTFEDIDDYPWAKEAIETLATLGIIQGTSETTFDPGSNITRADFITLLVRMLKMFDMVPDDGSDSNFDDVQEGMYYYEPIGIAKKLGIVQGIGANKFNPSGQITREDLMVMVARALKIANKITTTGSYADISRFNDASEVADYAVESIAILVKEGIIVGNPNNTINPKGNATRAETAVILYRVYLKYFAAEQDS